MYVHPWNYHHNQVVECSHYSTKLPNPLCNQFSFNSHPQITIALLSSMRNLSGIILEMKLSNMYSLYLASCDWILFLKFIHFVAYVSSSFLFYCWIVYTVCIYFYSIYLYLYLGHRLFVHSLVDGYLGYFQLGAIMNTAIINIYLQAFLYTYVFISLMKIPRSGIVEITGSS